MSETVRVRGLDSIRFICALWVVLGHLGLPFVESIDTSNVIGYFSRAMLRNLISGPAAVIVFFVISGFCIHFPYRSATTVPLIPYFARRHVRILVPVAVAIGIGWLVGFRLSLFEETILWSLVCEEIYYTLYPVLLRIRGRVGWTRMIVVAYAASLAVVMTDPIAGNYPSYGAGLNWILGLPCWLLGCQIAQSWGDRSRSTAVAISAIWMWRLGVLAVSCVCSVLRFHSSLTYPWTLNFFAVLAAIWLQKEMVWFRDRKPSGVLEFGGRFSYSIYLVHLPAAALFVRFADIEGLPEVVEWALRLGSVLMLCYVFFLLVEWPSHKLARRLYGVFMSRRQVAESLAQ